jgi:hypothetical protein
MGVRMGEGRDAGGMSDWLKGDAGAFVDDVKGIL